MHAAWWVAPLVLALSASAAGSAPLQVADAGGSLGRARAPVEMAVTLSAAELRAAKAGALFVVERGDRKRTPVPAQFEADFPGSTRGHLWWLMTPGPTGRRTFDVRTGRGQADTIGADTDAASGQVVVRERGRPVLQYNYRTVEPGEVMNKVTEPNRIYTRARSDYIHPLYGPDGEELTRDWPLEHPHHRGIYWAWPEVDWHGERGDLHALQRVFARPTGHLTTTSGPVFAQVVAENDWRWDDKDAIVRETATIRAYHATPAGRLVDLRFEFRALGDDVLLARRGAEHYGGLNVRLAAIQDQQILWHTDGPGAEPRMAWETMQGRFGQAGHALAVSVFQNPGNPEYPGDWVKYPELNWSQPTFPTAGTRYKLTKDRPLVLRFRVWVTSGDVPADALCADVWRTQPTGQ